MISYVRHILPIYLITVCQWPLESGYLTCVMLLVSWCSIFHCAISEHHPTRDHPSTVSMYPSKASHTFSLTSHYLNLGIYLGKAGLVGMCEYWTLIWGVGFFLDSRLFRAGLRSSLLATRRCPFSSYISVSIWIEMYICRLAAASLERDLYKIYEYQYWIYMYIHTYIFIYIHKLYIYIYM